MGFGHTGTLNINGASLIFNVTNAGTQFNIGLDGGNGIVNMTGGAVTINDAGATPGIIGSISIGFPFGATAANATFNQSGGTVSVSAGALNVGVANGTGTYNLTNTAVLRDQGATVYIGASTGGVGNVNISGNAIVDLQSISAGFQGQLYVGDNLGIGTITQNGANTSVTLNVINIAQFGSNASIAAGGGGTGTYNLLAGTLDIGGHGAAFGMAAGGVGFFNQSGGVLNATAPLIIGHAGTGTYTMSGGTANLGAGLSIAELAGSIGTVNQTGGLVTISGGSLAVGVAGARGLQSERRHAAGRRRQRHHRYRCAESRRRLAAGHRIGLDHQYRDRPDRNEFRRRYQRLRRDVRRRDVRHRRLHQSRRGHAEPDGGQRLSRRHHDLHWHIAGRQWRDQWIHRRQRDRQRHPRLQQV